MVSFVYQLKSNEVRNVAHVSMKISNMRADTRRRYEKLLQAGRELFVEKGFEGASLNELVERAGGSKASIYSYFNDKEGLFRAVMDEMMEDLLSPLDEQIDESHSLEETLIAMADRTLEVLTSPMGTSLVSLVHAESSRQPALGKAYNSIGPKRAMKSLAETLRSETEKGSISVTDPNMASQFFWGMLLQKPVAERLCNVARPMSKARRRKYVAYVVGEFLTRFADD